MPTAPFQYVRQDPADAEPQDWAGYEGAPPDPKWPGRAKIAVSFVIHAEAGAERHVTVSRCLNMSG
jgi:allantoinase